MLASSCGGVGEHHSIVGNLGQFGHIFFVESFYLQVPINLGEFIQLITYMRWWFQRFFSDVHLVFELDDSSAQF